jgi:hypothetical protein
MKIKRFNNLWAMGLILCGVLLVAFYIAKIFFPQFIIGIAETPRLVEIGTAIQSNKWYLHIFNFAIGYIHGYIYCCACCRTYKLSWKGNIIFLSASILLRLVSEFYPTHYTTINYVNFIFTPFLICLIDKKVNKDTFISTILCFTLDLMFQVLSMLVRNLPALSLNPNVVSYVVLLIDMIIWRMIFYLFFNYKIKNKESNEDGI